MAAKRATAKQKTARYLAQMVNIRGAGAPETSHYSALETLLAEVGGELNPKVEVVGQLRNTGAGMPDFGLYTKEQRKRNKGKTDWENPDRGVVEVKKPEDDFGELLKSAQLVKYAKEYGVVLATNYRQFALVEKQQGGGVKPFARCDLAASPEAFWTAAAKPQKTAESCGEKLCEFLRRALSHRAPITSAKDVAVMLASFAREALALLEQQNDETALLGLRESLESALSMKFESDDGEKFFRSTLAQTIFYGIFSAWLRTPANETFNWKSAAHYVRTPVMRALLGEITNPDRLGRLGLAKLLDNASASLARVENKGELFGGMDIGNIVLHFYEPFLADFDPELRKDLGVWYTPPEIVQYMVERADRVLRSELNIPDGLAGDNVFILDPCGGTGTFIVETLKRIHKTHQDRGAGSLAAAKTKEAAMNRVFGFEILTASYIIAHWQISELLREEIKAPLNDGERAAIYLTNSLTDWNEKEQPPLNIPGLQEERDAANEIKRNKEILVILGNPPYNAFAGTSPKEEGDLVAPYKDGLIDKWGIKKFNMDDLYVRFFRMAENRITKTGRGIVSFISNYSYTADPTFVVMREKLLRNFDKIWVENMHGDRNKSERAPDGKSSNTIFAMRGYSPGIRQGVVIGLLAKTGDSKAHAEVLYRDDIDAAGAEERRAQLLASLDEKDAAKFNALYKTANPQEWNKLSFRPLNVGDDYLQWPLLSELSAVVSSNGLNENRGGALLGIDRAALEKRMHDYFDETIDWEDYRAKGGGLAKNAAGFDAKAVRQKVISKGFNSANILPYTMRPFDDGFCYYTNASKVWNRARPDLYAQYKVNMGNQFIVSRNKGTVANEGAPVYTTSYLGDLMVMPAARYTPFCLPPEGKYTGGHKTANLSAKARDYLSSLGFGDPDNDMDAARALWLHTLAIGYSPAYQTENADGLRIDWPRIPLPSTAEALKQSAHIGKKVGALLDTSPMDTRVGPKALDNLIMLAVPTGQEWSLSDFWGYRDGKGKVYPGVGKTSEQNESRAPEELGAVITVHANDESRWETVPLRAWEYRIGGFQVARKWLSYRANGVLGRALTTNEALTFSDIIRRISALILMQKELDDNYRAVRENAVNLTDGAD